MSESKINAKVIDQREGEVKEVGEIEITPDGEFSWDVDRNYDYYPQLRDLFYRVEQKEEPIKSSDLVTIEKSDVVYGSLNPEDPKPSDVYRHINAKLKQKVDIPLPPRLVGIEEYNRRYG
jgi:hypothetical protein